MKFTFLSSHAKVGGRTRVHKKDTLSPERDWLLGISFASILFLGVAAYAGYDFYDQYTDAGEVDVQEESVPRYRKDEADRILEYYEGRVRTFEELRSERVPASIAPSTPVPTTSVGSLPQGTLIAQ